VLNKNSGETPLPPWTTGDPAGFPAALREPSRAELFSCSCDDFAISPKKTKTYRRFSGTIFFGGVEFVKVPDDQWLASQEIPKKPEKPEIKWFF
jgi:hypothetical protein